MALNFPDAGENLALESIVNKTAPQNLVLRLYSNNITPSDTDVTGTYTEATFPGYAAITLAGASWNAAAAGSIYIAVPGEGILCETNISAVCSATTTAVVFYG
jgi:hypothetical protein